MVPDLRQIEAAVQNVLNQEAVELVDLRYLREGGRNVLRFYLDKTGGFSLGDCEYMSNRIGGILDVTDLIPYSYVLEISSPGVDRVLKKEKDFQRFLGHRVKIHLREPQEGRRNFSGYLKTFDNGWVTLEDGEQSARFSLEGIEEARLDPEIEI